MESDKIKSNSYNDSNYKYRYIKVASDNDTPRVINGIRSPSRNGDRNIIRNKDTNRIEIDNEVYINEYVKDENKGYN